MQSGWRSSRNGQGTGVPQSKQNIKMMSHERRGFSNHRQFTFLFNSFFRLTANKTRSSLLFYRWPVDSPHSNAENCSISWHQHECSNRLYFNIIIIIILSSLFLIQCNLNDAPLKPECFHDANCIVALGTRVVIMPTTGPSTEDHDDAIKWNHSPRYWPFVRGIHRSRWIPCTKANDAELWCFLWSAPE